MQAAQGGARFLLIACINQACYAKRLQIAV